MEVLQAACDIGSPQQRMARRGGGAPLPSRSCKQPPATNSVTTTRMGRPLGVAPLLHAPMRRTTNADWPVRRASVLSSRWKEASASPPAGPAGMWNTFTAASWPRTTPR